MTFKKMVKKKTRNKTPIGTKWDDCTGCLSMPYIEKRPIKPFGSLDVDCFLISFCRPLLVFDISYDLWETDLKLKYQ